MSNRSMCRAVGLVVLLSFAMSIGSSCSVSETLDAPRCSPNSSEVLISAQSVPTASLLACFDTLPTGWSVGTVDIGDQGTVVVFDSDRAGPSAARFRYTAACEIGAATQTPSDFERADRFEWIKEVQPRFRANRYYRFDGGCVIWEFDFDHDAPAAMAVELGHSLQFVDRAEVNADMRAVFVDEDL